jgi:hypothetical protein
VTDDHAEIVKLLADYLENNPTQRFAQAIFNLRVNEFADKMKPENKGYLLRDIYNDSDEQVINRIKNQLNFFKENFPNK